MEEVKYYNLSQKEFNKLYKLADNIYNTAIVVDFFCENQTSIEELGNLAPIIKNLRKDADLLNAFFIDNDEEKQLNISNTTFQ